MVPFNIVGCINGFQIYKKYTRTPILISIGQSDSGESHNRYNKSCFDSHWGYSGLLSTSNPLIICMINTLEEYWMESGVLPPFLNCSFTSLVRGANTSILSITSYSISTGHDNKGTWRSRCLTWHNSIFDVMSRFDPDHHLLKGIIPIMHPTRGMASL